MVVVGAGAADSRGQRAITCSKQVASLQPAFYIVGGADLLLYKVFQTQHCTPSSPHSVISVPQNPTNTMSSTQAHHGSVNYGDPAPPSTSDKKKSKKKDRKSSKTSKKRRSRMLLCWE
ncbi:hypothetical protein PG997_007271 [Apiospora hydei]|uniref:Uncharacterized protein n=1 Tax=Apiospora hydei TaxID=1337664 RepID=A0ABR1W7J7_9PEZI